MKQLFIFLGVLLLPGLFRAQESLRLQKLESQLDSMSTVVPALMDTTDVSLRYATVAEYVRAIGMAHGINVFIEDSPGQLISSEWQHESVISVILFICRKYQYQLRFTGTIIEFLPYHPAEEIQPKPSPLQLQFSKGKLSADLRNDSLSRVIRRISELTGIRLLTPPGTEGRLSAYLPPTPLDTALEAIFLTNGFQLRKMKKGYFLLQPIHPDKDQTTQRNPGNHLFQVEAFHNADESYISVSAQHADLEELTRQIFESLEESYLIYERLEGSISIDAEITRLEDLLSMLFQATPYTYKKQGELYLIGSREYSNLKSIRLVHLKHRPTFQALDLVPEVEAISSTVSEGRQMNASNSNQNQSYQNQQYQQNGSGWPQSSFQQQEPFNSDASIPPEIQRYQSGEVEMIEYPELNQIILRGPSDRVDEIAAFLESIDRPVPMVRVEMIVVEVNQDRLINTGVKAGRKANSDTTSLLTQLIPGLGLEAGGNQLNALLSQVPFLSPLGRLNQSFYLQLRAQEANGNLSVEMQPVLSMLNGRTASLVIGQTQYFLLETQTAANGAVNNFTQFTQRFERIDTNIRLSIRPWISGDETVTLEVLPDFTTPVGSFDAELPPTIATRRFDSTIRVKNGETVILGGLSEDQKHNNSDGLPILSRIPVVKWIFGNVDKGKSSSSLLIYLTPFIEYQ